MKTIKKGSKGDEVKVLQLIVGVTADGIFGSKTKTAVKNWQKKNGLSADGVAGPKTWAKVVDIAPMLKTGSSGTWVKVLEVLLETMTDDGKYLAAEKQAVKAYQTSKKLSADGIVGPKTWAALFGIVSSTTAPTVTTNGTDSKQPVDYKQYDSKWGKIVYTKNNTYNKKQTISNSGCGTTAAADIIATWWDKSVTPKETSAWSVANGFRTNNSGTAWGYFEWVAKKYKASKFVQTTSFATMQGCLADGGYVVVSFRPSKWTSGG
jgi:peptidoglycan hydrolase-like protein with peptidoglycan-binding domain